MNRSRANTRGLSIVELPAIAVVLVAGIAMAVPLLDTTSCDVLRQKSIDNLRELGTAHAQYAADWNDRQFTLVRDDLGQYDGRCDDYQQGAGCHPPLVLDNECTEIGRSYAFGCEGGGGSCDKFWIVKPFNFRGAAEYYGSFRIPSAEGFNDYVNGRFFDPTFYAPADKVVLEDIGERLAHPCRLRDVNDFEVMSSSYVTSAAAMFDPAVFGGFEEGGWRDPDNLDDGYRSPAVSQAAYPSQKSRMLEHHWLQYAPDPCNPGFAGCVPYYFNHGLSSIPMTLFYDGHVRGLSTLESIMADSRVLKQTGTGYALWSRDTPLGNHGYLQEYGYDLTQTSYHVLTTQGIRGRDTTK